ncbi:hypothetical protein ANCCAN_24434 [Ancylostoma caninum]|uniref:EndoU domain-containing protein n=1 Tax=Ancylostoma caninum TaxID=29170 RepID=A0A368FFK5_ANCCA|nr:hypothetical protein ANCCAN_24434 [Ancylostoma caninum]
MPSSATTKTPFPLAFESHYPFLFQDLVNKTRSADVDKALSNEYSLDWGNKMCKTEALMYGFRKSQIQLLFHTWTSTQVFNLAFHFLKDNALVNCDFLVPYYSTNKFYYASGFEHVFIGEWRDQIVDGQHNRVVCYNLRKADKINYHGYYSYRWSDYFLPMFFLKIHHIIDLAGIFQYVWGSQMKKIGGFLIDTSPGPRPIEQNHKTKFLAFNFFLFTLCVLTCSGEAACRYSINNHPLAVTSYTQFCDIGTCIFTSYPEDNFQRYQMYVFQLYADKYRNKFYCKHIK